MAPSPDDWSNTNRSSFQPDFGQNKPSYRPKKLERKRTFLSWFFEKPTTHGLVEGESDICTIGNRSIVLDAELDVRDLIVMAFNAHTSVRSVIITTGFLNGISTTEMRELLEAIGSLEQLQSLVLECPTEDHLEVLTALATMISKAKNLSCLTVSNLDVSLGGRLTNDLVAAIAKHPTLTEVKVKMNDSHLHKRSTRSSTIISDDILEPHHYSNITKDMDLGSTSDQNSPRRRRNHNRHYKRKPGAPPQNRRVGSYSPVRPKAPMSPKETISSVSTFVTPPETPTMSPAGSSSHPSPQHSEASMSGGSHNELYPSNNGIIHRRESRSHSPQRITGGDGVRGHYRSPTRKDTRIYQNKACSVSPVGSTSKKLPKYRSTVKRDSHHPHLHPDTRSVRLSSAAFLESLQDVDFLE